MRSTSFRKDEPRDEYKIHPALGCRRHDPARLLQFFEMVFIDHYDDCPVRTWLTALCSGRVHYSAAIAAFGNRDYFDLVARADWTRKYDLAQGDLFRAGETWLH